jgi:hypothetical protein
MYFCCERPRNVCETPENPKTDPKKNPKKNPKTGTKNPPHPNNPNNPNNQEQPKNNPKNRVGKLIPKLYKRPAPRTTTFANP